MKKRIGYVSNSSSSSFVVLNLDRLTEDQIDCILHYDQKCYEWCITHNVELVITDKTGFDRNVCDGVEVETAADDPDDYFGILNDMCRFEITVNKEENCIDLFTIMDNFNMRNWLRTIGVSFRQGDGY